MLYSLLATFDEVGSNTSMLKDGHNGGEKFLCQRGSVPKKVSAKKDKRWTALSVTSFCGKQALLVVIIQGAKRSLTVESGIDTYVTDVIGDEEDFDFFTNNCGPGKRFPCGPTYNCQGKEMPRMVRYSEGGGITTEKLVYINYLR